MSTSNPSDFWTAKDRRVMPRLDSHERAVIRRLEDERVEAKEHSCGVLDISQNGARLFTRQHLSVGEEVEILIERTGHRRAHTLLGVVRWLTPSMEVAGNFVGLQFLEQRDLFAWRKTFH